MAKKVMLWSARDTPIPKKGEVITNMFHEKYKVVGRVKTGKDYELTLQKV